MKLKSLLSIISADEIIHIVTQDDSVYFGTVRDAYSELKDEIMENATANAARTNSNGLCIEIA